MTITTTLETNAFSIGDHVYLVRKVPTYPTIGILEPGRIVQAATDPDSPDSVRYSVDFDNGDKGFFYASELRLNPEIERAEFARWIGGMLD